MAAACPPKPGGWSPLSSDRSTAARTVKGLEEKPGRLRLRSLSLSSLQKRGLRVLFLSLEMPLSHGTDPSHCPRLL